LSQVGVLSKPLNVGSDNPNTTRVYCSVLSHTTDATATAYV